MIRGACAFAFLLVFFGVGLGTFGGLIVVLCGVGFVFLL